MRLGGLESDGERIDNLDRRDLTAVSRHRAGAVLDGGQALDREFDVLGREWRPIMKLYVGPQLEFPGEVVQGIPGRRQTGDHPQVLVAVNELIEDMLRDILV